MVSLKFLLVALASLAAVVNVAYGIKCYVCTSVSDGCGEDDFKKDDSWIKSDCGICSKTVAGDGVARLCLPNPLDVFKEECKELGGGTQCWCKGDLCNSATNIRSSVAMAMGITLAAVFARKILF